MTAQEKLKLFVQVRYDISMASGFADTIKHNNPITHEEAKELLRRCVKVNASAQAWERAMAGVEPPRVG